MLIYVNATRSSGQAMSRPMVTFAPGFSPEAEMRSGASIKVAPACSARAAQSGRQVALTVAKYLMMT